MLYHSWFRHQILAKYIIKRIFWLFLAIFLVLSLVIFGHRSIILLVFNYQFGMPLDDTLVFIMLNALEKLLPILALSLLLSIIIILGRFYKNNEMIVMNSIGIGMRHLVLFILPIILAVMFVAAIISLIIAPWAIRQDEMMRVNLSEVDKLALVKPKAFYYFLGDKVVLYVDKVAKDKTMEDVFVQANINDRSVIIVAKKAQIYQDDIKDVYLRLIDGKVYFGFLSPEQKIIENFQVYNALIKRHQVEEQIPVNINSLSTRALLNRFDQPAQLELQNRLNFPLSILVLSLLAIILAKMPVNASQAPSIIIAILCFVLYYHLISYASVDGQMNSWGAWWVHVMMLLLSMLFYRFKWRTIR